MNEAAAIRRAAAQVTELDSRLRDRDSVPGAIAAQVAVAADELQHAARACRELLDRAAASTSP